MLWIGLHLPRLSLESFAAGLPPQAANEPLALLDNHLIVSANAPAQALGVKPGLKRATALALAPQLRLGQADALRDAQALSSVAHAALAFTPMVVQPPADPYGQNRHHVLLEVQASLRYFAGRERLLQRLGEALAPLGHRVRVASAPTAQGAAVLACLAKARQPLHCADLPALHEALAQAPVWLLGPGREHWDALQGMGLRTLSDLRPLPRAGLARRFGPELLDEIDRAFGDKPDPRVPVSLPPLFDSRLELFARADTTEQVLHGAAVLLARLVAWASAQHARVRSFRLLMQHEPRHRQRDGEEPVPDHSTLEIALAEPSCDAAHLLVLLTERLAQVQLAAPSLELRLHCGDIARGAAPNGELFPSAKSEREGLTRLIERLQARLGREQVQRLVLTEDHRPERSCTTQPVDAANPQAAVRRSATLDPDAVSRAVAISAVRPAWLLPHPQALHERQHLPLLDGAPLLILSGPERIESGWWDGDPIARDYFIAQQSDGALVWIFRGRLPLADGPGPGWYLQGRFG